MNRGEHIILDDFEMIQTDIAAGRVQLLKPLIDGLMRQRLTLVDAIIRTPHDYVHCEKRLKSLRADIETIDVILRPLLSTHVIVTGSPDGEAPLE